MRSAAAIHESFWPRPLYSVTYGGLGAVIILLTWFYLTSLMLLVGAEINSEIEAAAAAKRLLTRAKPP
jgi:membrane protein